MNPTATLAFLRVPSCPLWLMGFRKAITTRDTKYHEGKPDLVTASRFPPSPSFVPLFRIRSPFELPRKFQLALSCFGVADVAIGLPEQVVGHRIIRVHGRRMTQSANSQLRLAFFLQHLAHKHVRP